MRPRCARCNFTGTLCALNSVSSIPVGWRGIFQPSEEGRSRSVREMIECGALSAVDAIVALHVDPAPCWQNRRHAGRKRRLVRILRWKCAGEEGHGARPHKTIDPIATARSS